MMHNNDIVAQLYIEHHDTLIELSNLICGKVCNQSEDMVQDLYLELLQEEELLDSALDEDGCFRKGFINFTLRERLAKIIINNCLVVTE